MANATRRLGCLESIEVYVTDQCGTPRICGLTNVAQVQFNRILDEVSEAVVVIPVSTGTSSTKPCCDCLDIIEPWCHELHIVRNGELVWSGPIIKITYGYTTVSIEARDVLAWTQVRIPKGVLDNTTATSKVSVGGTNVNTMTEATPGSITVENASNFSSIGGSITITTVPANLTATPPVAATTVTLSYKGISGNTLTGVIGPGTNVVLAAGMEVSGTSNGDEITDIAVNVLNVAFAEHDPCVLDYVVQIDLDDRPTLYANTAVSTNNGFTAFEGTVFDWLELLADNGLDYTVIGRSVLLAAQDTPVAALGTLRDEHIAGEIEVSKDGYAMATRVFSRFEQDDDPAKCAAQCKAGNNNQDCPVCDLTFAQPCSSVPCPAMAEAADLKLDRHDVSKVCYGPIERMFDDAAPLDYRTALQTAEGYIRDGSVAPRTVNFASGARLMPDTPWDFNDMIPGQKIRVALAGLCLDVNEFYRLQEVSYTLTAEGDEEITVALGAFNLINSL